MEIKCVITDDEPFARRGIREYIEKTSFLSLEAECENALELDSLLKKTMPDVIFLDVEMPGLTGIEFLSAAVNPPKIIIISAYEQYALKGYELDVFDYLLKPVSYERFLKASNKLYNYFEERQKKLATDHIFVKTGTKIKKVRLDDILYIQSLENYVLIHTHLGRDIVYCTLKIISESLPAAKFVQCHRSFIVNLEHIESIEGNMLQLGSFNLPVARNIKESLLSRLTANTIIVRNKTGRSEL